MTTRRETCSMEELTWQEVRKDVARVNPELAKVIDEVDPGSEYKLFKVRYPFGAKILKKGALYLPDNHGRIIPLKQHLRHIQEQLGYNLGSNPVSIVLKNSVELFLELDDRTVPFYGPVSTGKLFGTWRVIAPSVSHHPVFLWDLTAGARSIFMLPKITDTLSHNRLKKKFYLTVEKPKRLLDHWEVFRQIANHQSTEDPWYVEILFFSGKWFEDLEDCKWILFNNYLLKTAWRASEFWRSEFIWDAIFSLIQKKKKIKPSSHVANTVKHLLAIANGAVPGFAPISSNEIAPISLIQKIYVEDYRLRDYLPIIMCPEMFGTDETTRPVYYSLQFPASFEFSLKSSERSTIISDLYLVKSLMSKYLKEIVSSDLNIGDIPLYDIAKRAKFDFFHSDSKEYYELRDSNNIFKEDSRFGHHLNDKFPIASTFVRGCIRISLKQ